MDKTNRSAFDVIEAHTYDSNNGLTFLDTSDEGYERTVNPESAKSGCYLGFNDIDFGPVGADQIRVMVFSKKSCETVSLEIRIDHANGPVIGVLAVFKQWLKWSVLACNVVNPDGSRITGVHAVYLKIASESANGIGVKFFQFARQSEFPAPAPRPAQLPPPENGEYNVYFGNLHSHTGFSDGAGNPETAFDYAKNTAGLDFLAVTEHANLYDHSLDWDKSVKWKGVLEAADRNTKDGCFVAIAGTETTWYNGIGHMNTFGIDFFINPYNTYYNELSNYYDLIKRYPASINQWNHPWDANFHDFLPYDKAFDDVMYLLEVPCIANPGVDSLSYYIDCLDKGWHVAPAGNQDNHIGNWGTMNNNRTAVLCRNLTRDQIFDAVRNYRVYSTSDVNMCVIYKINDSIMGTTLLNPMTLDVTISAVDPDPEDRIIRIDLITEGGEVVKTETFSSNSVNWNFTTSNDKKYYFVKVTQADGDLAITAPIWTGR